MTDVGNLRDATGTIQDQSPTETKPEQITEVPVETKTQETTPTDKTASADDKSLLNKTEKDTKAPEGAPEKYEAFTVPEGFTLDETVSAEAGKIFKELELSQVAAQKLVDFYISKTTEAADAPYALWKEQNDTWVKEIMSDPKLGHRISEVKRTISLAIDGLGDPTLAQGFREAMDYTGAGNNPAFIRAFYALAQKVTEGTHVSGNGPSKLGQQAPGRVSGPGAAAMYPNLPT